MWVKNSDFTNRNTIVVDSSRLHPCLPNHVSIILNRCNSQIIKGTVYDRNKIPSVGAAIQVIEINPYNEERKVLGIAVTDDMGNYMFSIRAYPDHVYELRVFAPISSK